MSRSSFYAEKNYTENPYNTKKSLKYSWIIKKNKSERNKFSNISNGKFLKFLLVLEALLIATLLNSNMHTYIHNWSLQSFS